MEEMRTRFTGLERGTVPRNRGSEASAGERFPCASPDEEIEEVSSYPEYQQNLMHRHGINPEQFDSNNPEYVLEVFMKRHTVYRDFFAEAGADFDDLFSITARSNPEGFKDAVVKKLDFETLERFYETGQLIELLQREYEYILEHEEDHLYDGISDDEMERRSPGTIALEAALRQAVEGKQGSALLHSRAQTAQRQLFGEEEIQFQPPLGDFFDISEGQLAIFDGNTIRLVEQKKYRDKSVLSYDEEYSDEGVLDTEYAPDRDEGRILSTEILKQQFGITASEEDIQDFLYLQSPEMRSYIQEIFSLELSTLPLKEQFYLLQYLRRVSVGDVEEAKAFFQTFGREGTRTFLALEKHTGVSGIDIVDFAIREVNAAQTFTAYGSLLDEASDLQTVIREEFDCESIECDKVMLKARERVLAQAHDYLIRSVRGEMLDMEVLEKRARQARSLSAALSSGISEHVISSVEEMNSFSSRTLLGEEALQNINLVTEMERIIRRNRAHYETSQQDQLVKHLYSSLGQPHTSLLTWNTQDQLLAFGVVHENPPEESVHFESFNINPDLKIARAGKGLINEVLNYYGARGWRVTAEASPENTPAYLKMGSVAVAREEHPAETYLLKLVYEADGHWPSKNINILKYVSELGARQEMELPGGALLWRAESSSDTPPLLEHGYVITKMRRVQDNLYFILEPGDQLQSATDSQIKIAA